VTMLGRGGLDCLHKSREGQELGRSKEASIGRLLNQPHLTSSSSSLGPRFLISYFFVTNSRLSPSSFRPEPEFPFRDIQSHVSPSSSIKDQFVVQCLTRTLVETSCCCSSQLLRPSRPQDSSHFHLADSVFFIACTPT